MHILNHYSSRPSDQRFPTHSHDLPPSASRPPAILAHIRAFPPLTLRLFPISTRPSSLPPCTRQPSPPQVSLLSLNTAIQSQRTTYLFHRTYNRLSSPNPPPTSDPISLAARIFSNWNFLSTVVRLYAAYHIDSPPLCTFSPS